MTEADDLFAAARELGELISARRAERRKAMRDAWMLLAGGQR